MATDKPTIPLKVWADCTQRFQDTLAPIAQQVQTIAEQQLRAIVEMWEQHRGIRRYGDPWLVSVELEPPWVYQWYRHGPPDWDMPEAEAEV